MVLYLVYMLHLQAVFCIGPGSGSGFAGYIAYLPVFFIFKILRGMSEAARRFKILVVEDNPGDAFIITEYLSEKFELAEVVVAVDFKAAGSILTQGADHYDVILLDLTLPDKVGAPLVDEMLHLAPFVPIIILTGYADVNFSAKSIALGISDYLNKDELTPAILYKSIIHAIERKKSYSELEESEKRYYQLFELSPQPMWVLNPASLELVHVNETAARFFGYAKEDLQRMRVTNLLAHGVINAALPWEEQMAQYRHLLELPMSAIKHLTRLGDVRYMEVYSAPVQLNNQQLLLVTAVDVTERNLFEQRITRAIIKAQEDERFEIGAELHDNICQILSSGQLSLGMLKRNLPEASMKWFEKGIECLHLATDEIRNLSHQLAPAYIGETSFKSTVQNLLELVFVHNDISVSLHFDDALEESRLEKEQLLNLYRILQEQLKNIQKHAKASSIEIDLYGDDESIVLRILDDGVGFDMADSPQGIGMANMRRRSEVFGGSLTINTSPGNGCEVVATMQRKLRKNVE